MSSLKLALIALAALSVGACAVPTPTHTDDNGVRAAAQKLIGQPASKAFELFGQPDQGMGPSSYGSGGFYAWNRVQTHVTPEQVFVSTGKEYVGQKETWVGVSGGGVAGVAQVGSEPVYRETGYYENRTVLDYFCSITLYTDGKDIITDASVINCMNPQ
ncbi:hypothetical protein [Pseudomonas tohonis]|uniref:hypothetical protein n=1 Tax=Pseudomonas tohonis TaxID=2725477 RepID=UPI0021DB23F6|nr:hypothetical protein [Pseudomonas tohonis]UXY50290.1 hypothetical protein N9L84_15000 [Pseudomonas tohonis]